MGWVGQRSSIGSFDDACAVFLANERPWEGVWQREEARVAEEIGRGRERLAAKRHVGAATAACGRSMAAEVVISVWEQMSRWICGGWSVLTSAGSGADEMGKIMTFKIAHFYINLWYIFAECPHHSSRYLSQDILDNQNHAARGRDVQAHVSPHHAFSSNRLTVSDLQPIPRSLLSWDAVCSKPSLSRGSGAAGQRF